jgi:hypothetical protein
VKFLSTPQVMVLDNQTANIRVGDQIPVTTRSSQSTTNPDAPIVTEVQFRDTGTLLTVTPRINAGGQITLEISQEVSIPGAEPAIGGGGNVSVGCPDPDEHPRARGLVQHEPDGHVPDRADHHRESAGHRGSSRDGENYRGAAFADGKRERAGGVRTFVERWSVNFGDKDFGDKVTV